MSTVRIRWDGEKAIAMAQAAGEKAVRDAAQYLLDESKKQVPLDTGALERSGAVSTSGLQATVSYDTPYAVRWHETSANFQRGRKKKYLEDPCNDPAVQEKIAEYFKSQCGF